MNLLSVAAAYGAITLVFQKGAGIGFFNAIGFNFHQSPAIEAWLPLFLFSILFGLSMDYQVFLLSRIREEYDKTHDNTEAVATACGPRRDHHRRGPHHGGRVHRVRLRRLGPLQQMGFGLAVAVLMDATIVRTILVPATHAPAGRPQLVPAEWLEWLPKVHVEGREPERVQLIPDSQEELIPAVERAHDEAPLD